MKFSVDTAGGVNVIRAYGGGQVRVDDTVYGRSLILTPDCVIPDWPPQRFAALDRQHLEQVADLDPELVVLGTGDRQQFPRPAVTAPLIARGIGVEVMDTAAACRTYNILHGENRRVAAALILEPPAEP